MFEIVYSAVRFAALKGAPEEAEIMQIFIKNYDFLHFQNMQKSPSSLLPQIIDGTPHQDKCVYRTSRLLRE